MQLTGFPHLTAVTADAPRNHAFYTKTLGLRLVKKTVNQDDVSAYHLFYADGLGTPPAAASRSSTGRSSGSVEAQIVSAAPACGSMGRTHSTGGRPGCASTASRTAGSASAAVGWSST